MAVAYDAFSDAGEFTAATDPKTWTHTPVGTPRGVVVFIQQTGTSSDFVNGTVSYGGVAMTRVPTNGFAQDSAIEVASIYAYFLGSGIPTGARTVSINHDNGIFGTKHAICVTLTGAQDLEVVASGKLENDTANPSIALDSGAKTAIKLFNLYSGRDALANITNTAGMTRIAASKYAAGNFCYVYGYRTTPGSGSETVAQTADSDDVAMIGIAVAEKSAVTASAGNTAGTGASASPAPSVKASAASASASGSAYSPSQPTSVSAGHAMATAWASQGEGGQLDVDPPVLTATASAGTPSVSLPRTVEGASATVVAPAAGQRLGTTAGLASPNATAGVFGAMAEVVQGAFAEAEAVAATAAAGVATAGPSAPAEAAEAAMAAGTAGVSVSPAAPHGSVTATANRPAPDIRRAAGIGQGTGAASAAVPSVTVAPASAEAGATAHSALQSLSTAEAAQATGAASSPTAGISPDAGGVTVTAVSSAPSTSVRVNAGHAGATASAEAVAIALAMHPDAASAIAAAYPDQVAIATGAGLVSVAGVAYGRRNRFSWRGSSVTLAAVAVPTATLRPDDNPTATLEVTP